MRRASGALAAALLALAWGLVAARAAESVVASVPARPSASSAASLIERGRQACDRGDYEACLGEMMLSVMENPKAAAPREYLRLAAEGLLAQRRQALTQQHGELLRAYDAAIRLSREATLRWNDWMFHARRASRKGKWALAYDGFVRVLDENPLHEDARAGLHEAKLAVARTLAEGLAQSKKDELVYYALLAYDAKRMPEALQRFKKALARPDRRAELGDDRIQSYLGRLSPAPKPRPARPAGIIALPRIAAPTAPRSARPDRVTIARPLPQPGQWAHSQGMSRRAAGRIEEAVELLADGALQAPENETYRRDLDLTRAELATLLERRKADAQRDYTLGIVLYGQGRVIEAVAQWRKAVERDPEHRYAQRALQHAQQELEEERR